MDKAVFLDRDGVVNEVLSHRVKFVNRPEDFHLLKGVGEAIRKINELNFKVFVVTNQGGIGLGYMKERELRKIHAKMQNDLAEYGAIVHDVAYCPHKPNEGCACRKPKPCMLLRLAKKHQIDLKKSYMVGDREPDIEAGKEAKTITVLVGSRKKENANADLRFTDLLEFANWLAKRASLF
ncbi:HAD family hydrolase [Pseudogracilibacillus sp. SE30717A]|uniref:D-glycero-alpha-D-manno-heptose-1,7-bisphosphate 7-phosphatase n=1 Tax=Pseudogracilibacillus sp. SE30717A TaxID=3098293 RepID=UPI00300E68D4